MDKKNTEQEAFDVVLISGQSHGDPIGLPPTEYDIYQELGRLVREFTDAEVSDRRQKAGVQLLEFVARFKEVLLQEENENTPDPSQANTVTAEKAGGLSACASCGAPEGEWMVRTAAANGNVKKPRTTVTVERVRELFTYDPETGKIFHKADRPGGVHAGVEIGYTHVSGQRFLTADRKRLGLHRVAWAIYYGEWPEGMVDHINRDPLDNRIANLRLATYSQNGTNYLRSSKTGYRGVRSLRGKAWQASIKKDGKVTHLGTFQNIEDAARAYNKAAIELHGEFAVLNPIGEDRVQGAGDL